jgi:hypothetical protein
VNGGGNPAVPPPAFSFPFAEALPVVDIELMVEAVVVVGFLALVVGAEEADGMVMVVVEPDVPFFVFACSR